MQDLKTGHLLGASPRAQFFGQILGSTFSVVVSAVAYNLYTRVYTIPGPEFPAPTAYVWLSFARLLGSGGALPPYSKVFMVAAAVVSAILAAWKTRAQRQSASWAIWIPSGVAFAIGFLNTPSFSIARFIGGLIEFVYRRRLEQRKRNGESVTSGDIGLIVMASGFVLGEGVVSVIGLVLKSFGVGVLSCRGCTVGACGSC